MRKVILAGAVVVAGAAGYFLTQQQGGDAITETKTSPLAYVPADTVFFSGQLAPFPLKDYLQSTTFSQPQIPQDLLEELDDSTEPQGRFLGSLAKSYLTAASSAEAFQKAFALPDEMKAIVYAVGFLPVIRYEVTDEKAFWTLLDKAELESEFKHEARTLGSLNYRAYPLEKNERGELLELVVAYEDGWATWTINTHVNDQATLETALAQKAPAAALKDSGIIDGIATKHGFQKDVISYIDHKGLVTAFTTAEGNTLAKMLTKAMQLDGSPDDLAMIRTAECQAEMGAMADNWPRTVFGMRSADDMKITPEHSFMRMSIVVESNNKVVMDALTSMQGFIPSYLKEAQVLGFGLGIDANKLGPALGTIWSNMLEPVYKCEPLAEMQMGIRQANPAGLAMFTGMAQGVKGIAMGIQDFSLNLDAPQPTVDSLDGLVSLSADNPEVLFNMAKSFAPPLAAVQLPADGSPVDLSTVIPLPPEVKAKPMLTLKGKHLVIYSGEGGKAAADSLATEAPVSNGLYSIALDYKKLFTPILPVLEMAAGDPEVSSQLEVLKKMDMRAKIDLNLTPQGIEIVTEADIKAPKK
ncbi:hypothetical protein [Neptuniibacter caesariensis]|uniref:DUF3352 domain-containing protein n=1 Tax=Neptuniibacter caesariensis TaxID=207954 RepID=A0A7U8C9A9_NEPCE|nr:hypothetical protein [Neptuniibacter caesariensis]EAR62256.1 hypothetical protein MED92_14503 [Oceanospirillum sp. MED92] [Neptuniibacter caesariensis]